MKVLSAPRERKWQKKITCDECGAKLLVELSDFKKRALNALSINALPYVRCPRCKMEITLEWSELPSSISSYYGR